MHIQTGAKSSPNCNLIARLWHYIRGFLKNLDAVDQELNYASYAKVHNTARPATFNPKLNGERQKSWILSRVTSAKRISVPCPQRGCRRWSKIIHINYFPRKASFWAKLVALHDQLQLNCYTNKRARSRPHSIYRHSVYIKTSSTKKDHKEDLSATLWEILSSFYQAFKVTPHVITLVLN